MQSSGDAIVSKDLDGTIRSWNPAAERIFGYGADEMLGRSIFRLIPDELHEEERGLLARIAAGEHVAHYETTRVRKDGQRIQISLTLSPIRDHTGRLIGASAIKRDITAQRALEMQLQQARRMEAIGRLAGGIAHDFNNLLTVIGGMTDLILQRLPEGSRERRDLEEVARAAERAAALTQQLLTFSRRQLTEVEALEPNQIIVGLEPMIRRLVGEHIVLRTGLAADAGPIRANRGQLEQVLVNLIVNARDAMPDGGTLMVETQNVDVEGVFAREQLRLEPGPYVQIAVSDTGAGMDPVTQASIFEPFFTTKEPGQGTGLGLATVYGIVQQSGGAIYVYSEPGHGTIFKVYLPRAVTFDGPRAGAGEPAPAVQPSRSPATILLVEDEPGVRRFTRQVLEEAGYRVLEAGTGDAALEMATAFDGAIDLLLADVVLPGINGRLVAERLQAARPEVRVLFMSGYTDDTVVRTGLITGGTAFVQKPFSPRGLLERVRATLLQPAPPPRR